MRVRVLAAIIVILIFSDAASSAETCRHQPAILALSELVIKERASLPRLVARRFGSEPAFLKMRYGDLPGKDAKALATDFAIRLDRLCSAVLYHQAEALILSGQPIFKFDTSL